MKQLTLLYNKGIVEIVLIVVLAVTAVASTLYMSLDSDDNKRDRAHEHAVQYTKHKNERVRLISCALNKTSDKWAYCIVERDDNSTYWIACPVSWKNKDKDCYPLELPE